jgi:hypothetical protein
MDGCPILTRLFARHVNPTNLHFDTDGLSDSASKSSQYRCWSISWLILGSSRPWRRTRGEAAVMDAHVSMYERCNLTYGVKVDRKSKAKVSMP